MWHFYLPNSLFLCSEGLYNSLELRLITVEWERNQAQEFLVALVTTILKGYEQLFVFILFNLTLKIQWNYHIKTCLQ